MINPSQLPKFSSSPEISLPKSNPASSLNSPQLSGLPSLTATPVNRDFSNTIASPKHASRNCQVSKSNTPRNSTKDTVNSKHPVDTIHNEHFSNSHKDSTLPLNKVRIKGLVPKLNLKGYIANQSPTSNTTETPKNQPKLISLRDRLHSSSARSLKASIFPKNRSGSNPNQEDIISAHFSPTSVLKEENNHKILHSKPIENIKEQGTTKEDGIKFIRSSSRQSSKVNLKLKTPIPLKKIGPPKTVLSSNKIEKLSLKWLTSDIAELAHICLPSPTGRVSPGGKFERASPFDKKFPESARARYQDDQSPASQLSDRSSLFSRAVQRYNTEEKEREETFKNNFINLRSNSVPYHLPQKMLSPHFATEYDNMSPSLQDEITTERYSPSEIQTLDERIAEDLKPRKTRKSVTFMENSNSSLSALRASSTSIPALNLSIKRVVKEGEVVNPSSFRKITQGTSLFHITKPNLTGEEDCIGHNSEEECNEDWQKDMHEDGEDQNRNIFNNSGYGFFEVNTDNEFIRKYMEGPRTGSKLSKDFLLDSRKLTSGQKIKNNHAPLVVSYRDKFENIIIQPRFMQQYGSMSFTELWSGQRKVEYVHAKKKEVHIRKMDNSEASETIFRPDKKKSKLFIQKRITANRGDYSIRSSILQEQIKTAASRLPKKQSENPGHNEGEVESQNGEPTKLRGVIDPDDEEDKDTSKILRRRASRKATIFVPVE